MVNGKENTSVKHHYAADSNTTRHSVTVAPLGGTTPYNGSQSYNNNNPPSDYERRIHQMRRTTTTTLAENSISTREREHERDYGRRDNYTSSYMRGGYDAVSNTAVQSHSLRHASSYIYSTSAASGIGLSESNLNRYSNNSYAPATTTSYYHQSYLKGGASEVPYSGLREPAYGASSFSHYAAAASSSSYDIGR